jgi:uncharacterized protein (DUF1800 family)
MKTFRSSRLSPLSLSSFRFAAFRPSIGSLSWAAVFGRATLVTFGVALSVASIPTTSFAQTNPSADAELLRATSRLGYGPTPSLISQVESAGGARAWAKRQIDTAYTASRSAPVIPADLALFNQSLPQTFAAVQKEREERRTLREARVQEQAKDMAMKPGQAAAPNNMATNPANNNADLDMFSREVTRGAFAWRMGACSSPDAENVLLARMTEFWFNHFNVFVGKGPVRPFVGHYAVNAIRANSLGKFEDLLLATARHPAMLFYLDQVQSVAEGVGAARGNARGLNENYARELMELHTLGVNGGYTQNDVRELARILTGWTVGPQEAEGFRFVGRLHDDGEKTLLGRRFSGGGENEGVEAIRMLARHPATAQRVARRMASFFVSDTPSQALVDKLARSFTASQGDIRALLRTLVDAPEFWAADQTLIKTPFDYACSSLAAIGGAKSPREVQISVNFLNQAGQPLHGWQTPDGYKTDAATWLAPEALTRRADYAMNLARNLPEPVFLERFFSPATKNRIAQEGPNLRAGLMLASPDFMKK